MKIEKELKIENDKLAQFYNKIRDNKIPLPLGVVDFKVLAEFLLKAINSTLAWCVERNPEAPSFWIENALIRWKTSEDEKFEPWKEILND